MGDTSQTIAHPPTSTVASGHFAAALLRASWLAILLGLTMQVLGLFAAAAVGFSPQTRAVVAAIAGGISWSVLVCTGLAIGLLIAASRPVPGGIAGLIAAPLAFTVARIAQQSVGEALGLSAGVSPGPPVLLLTVLKAAEYACLGLALAWLGRQRWGGVAAHVATGLAAGLVFGGIILWVLVCTTQPPLGTGALLSRGVNEVLFPAGCALVIFATTYVGRHEMSRSGEEIRTRRAWDEQRTL